MRRTLAAAYIDEPEHTPGQLAERKRISDRAILLGHIDSIIRPPAWVYEEMEEAIRHALTGDHTAKIESRDGRCYAVTELLERWELEELLEVYARPPDDPSYRDL